jgi:hypothetical protein
MTIAELRRLLPVDKEWTGEYLGGSLVVLGNAGSTTFHPNPPARRRVIKQSAYEMKSMMLDGPKANQVVYHNWKGTKARKENDAIILTDETGRDFLKITI